MDPRIALDQGISYVSSFWWSEPNLKIRTICIYWEELPLKKPFISLLGKKSVFIYKKTINVFENSLLKNVILEF